MLSICRVLASAGWTVRTLCTTAFDTPDPDPVKWHETAGLRLGLTRLVACRRPIWRCEADGIEHYLVDTGTLASMGWEDAYGADYEAALDALLPGLRVDVLLTYGGSPRLHRMRAKIRATGASVVLGLRNHGYFSPGAMLNTDRGLAPSLYLARKYADFHRHPVDGLPPPLIEADIVPSARDPVFFTFVNPVQRKGMFFFIRLADELSRRRPDIPLLILDAHGRAAQMVGAAAQRGIDLRRHANIMLAPKVAAPREFLRVTRAVLMPSLWEEPFGRVAAEAQLAGIPAIVSDRGGLPEAVGDGGFVLPIPAKVSADAKTLPPASAVLPWIELIERLADDDAFHVQACRDAAQAGERYREPVLHPRYVQYFTSLVSRR